MGTDIQIFAETFADGRRHLADVDLPDYRNYRTFAVLAGVRNGYGFAGFDKGDPITPTSQPRGLPDDLSQGYAHRRILMTMIIPGSRSGWATIDSPG